MSRIIVERPFDWCNQFFTNIYIDNEHIGTINAGKSIDCMVSPGEHKIATSNRRSLLSKPIRVNVASDESKTVIVESYNYSRITWPILFVILFAIAQWTGTSFEFDMHFINLIIIYAAIIYIYKYITSKFFYYKLKEINNKEQ